MNESWSSLNMAFLTKQFCRDASKPKKTYRNFDALAPSFVGNKSLFLVKTLQELAAKGKGINEDRLKHNNGSYSVN